MIEVSPKISAITINVNVLNFLVHRGCLMTLKKIQLKVGYKYHA